MIVGLGNPSPQYDHTRHNVGAQWVRWLAERYGIPLKEQAKFKGLVGRGLIEGHDVYLLLPTTYMNLSGEAVGPLARFYKIGVGEMLIAYDEMAFEPGIVRLKTGGGDNGHNGIKSVRAAMANEAGFHRLRIGVGHPGDKNRVTAYLTQVKMPAGERDLVDSATAMPAALLADILACNWQAAMNELHRTDA